MKRAVLGVLVAGCVVGVLGAPVASGAEGLSPWWGLSSGSRPTNLQSGVAKNEVQTLSVSATGGELVLVEDARFEIAFFKWDATPGEIQTGLEGIYGPGNVEVSGGVSDETGSKPYVITFTGELADRRVAPINAAFSEGAGFLNCGETPEEIEQHPNCKARANVTEITPGQSDGQIVVVAQNRGDAGTTGPVTVTDTLPSGLRAVAISGIAGATGKFYRGPVECSLEKLSCTLPGSKSLPAFETLEVRIDVVVNTGAKTGEQNSATVSGGGAIRTVSASHPIEVNGTTRFGIEDYELIPENVGGTVDTQAGSHPFQVTSVVTLNSQTPDEGRPRTSALPKDLVAQLPAGFVGNPTPFTQCTDKQFSETVLEEDQDLNACPSQSAIGVVALTFNEPAVVGFVTVLAPIFNMVPRPGEPARFGFKVAGIVPVFLDTSVRTGGDYGVNVISNNITQVDWLLGVRLTFWGVPGDVSHDGQRSWHCVWQIGECQATHPRTPPPFLQMPTSCDQSYESTLSGDSWASVANPAQIATPVTYKLAEAVDGCNRLPFTPSITVAPDVPDGSTPTGLTFDVHLPQEAALDPKGLAESALKDTTAVLPEGVTLNPGGADGLLSCTESQIGYTGREPGTEQDLFTSGLPEPFCADESKIGTVKIKTPLLPNALEGAVYLAKQDQNPFGSLVAMYLVAQDPVSGTLLKLPGEVKTDPVTGQITASVKNTPELPFEDLELHFFGGARAPLSSPPLCGSYTSSATFVPWSGNEPPTPTSSFDITSGPNGSPCHNPLPFSPSLTAGTTSIQAGGFSPFTMTMSRPDGSQNLKAIQLHMPPGLLGTLATVKLCKEEQANAGTCGPDSLIGHTTVSVGVGGNPYSVVGGQVFITEGYKGAPYGLSIVNPAKAGPFDLGQVIVRAKIEIDPATAILTITTDDTGPYKIPTILDGIPLQIQHVNVAIDRPGFTFNPTNCTPQAITGTLTSDQGATSALSVPFQITNCAVLAFKPKLTAKTNGKTSRAKGASLSVKLTYPAGPYDANIAKVKVDLPKQLPSRLTTLQKACPAATFNANPAACPPASIVGHAKATTPVLPTSLEGPAYFVSHGGEAFPELIIVLQGYGATVHLVGSTFISKAGITSSTFKQVPDVPVGTFELTLPQGKYSALAANGNLCTTKKLAMPTLFVAQNGATIHTSTPIVPTGCVKHAKAKKKAGHQTKKGKKRK